MSQSIENLKYWPVTDVSQFKDSVTQNLDIVTWNYFNFKYQQWLKMYA